MAGSLQGSLSVLSAPASSIHYCSDGITVCRSSAWPFLCYAALGLLFFATALLGLLSLEATIVFFFLLLACVGITNPNASSLSLAPFAKNAGSASALMGALQMGFGALISVLISMFDHPSATPVAAGIAVAGVLALLVFYIGKRNIKHSVAVQKDDVVLAH